MERWAAGSDGNNDRNLFRVSADSRSIRMDENVGYGVGALRMALTVQDPRFELPVDEPRVLEHLPKALGVGAVFTQKYRRFPEGGWNLSPTGLHEFACPEVAPG